MAEANELKTDSGAVSGLMEERPVAALPMEHKNQQAPVVIEQGSKTTYPIEQQVEENLSLADKEKELIIKAPKKHKEKKT